MKKWAIWAWTLLCLAALLGGCTEQTGQTGQTGQKTPEITDTSGFAYYVNLSNETLWDLCPVMDTKVRFLLLSGEDLVTIEDVQAHPEENLVADTVQFMFTGSCALELTRCSEAWMTEFPFWIYQTYRGVDWNEVAALAQSAQAGDQEAEETLREYETLYLADYEALTAEDLPQIYAYWVGNNITAEYGIEIMGQYTSLPLSVSGEEVTVDVGILNVTSRGWDQSLPSEGMDEDVYGQRLEDVAATYWGDGVVTLPPIEISEGDNDQTLTGIGLYGIEGEILDIQVNVNGQAQDWDGTTPLEIPAGASARLTVTLQTQANQVIGYCEDANLMVQREIGGEIQRVWYFASISQSWNIYELYAMMVDGLDISAYYAYSAGWEQPEAAQTRTCVEIPFDTVSVPKAEALAEDYDLYVTGAYYDDAAYTLCFSAGNHSEQTLTLAISNRYINHFAITDNYWDIEVAPGESADYEWRLTWEYLETIGVHALSGEDIFSIEFTCDALFDGKLLSDGNGGFVICEETAAVYPMGEEAEEPLSIAGTLALETGAARVYVLSLDTEPYSALRDTSKTTSPPRWKITLAVENLSGESLSCCIDGFYINDVSLDAMNAATLGSGGWVATVSPEVSVTAQGKIGQPETLTFTLTLNNTDTYTITADLTEE